MDRPGSGSRVEAGLLWSLVVVMAAIILAHVGLLPLGRWQGDEYILAAFAHTGGVDYFLGRVTGSSPRPVSEAVLFAYFWLVSALRRPLIQPMLSLHWLALALACFVTLRPQNWDALSWRILAAMTLLCFFLLGHNVTELFFWPAGVAPYLETLSAMSVLLFLTLDGRLQRAGGLAAGIAALSIAAAASESGAMFALAYAGLRILRSPGKRTVWVWAVPLAVAIAVLTTLAGSERLRAAESVGVQVPATHQLMASLSASLPEFGLDLIGSDVNDLTSGGLTPGHAIAAVAIKLLVFCALRWCWRLASHDVPRPAGLAVFAISVMAASFAMIVAAEFQFGTLCCERHESLRQCWFFLAIAALAALTAPTQCHTRARLLIPILLAAALVWALVPRVPAMIGDYGLRQAAITARTQTWGSGLAPGPAMFMRLPPSGDVVHGSGLSPGHYTVADKSPLWWTTGILLFFDKRTLDVVPPI